MNILCIFVCVTSENTLYSSMHDFIRRIEHLLPEHDCIIVPGLGGFVQNEIEAYFDHKNQFFYPASKQIGFNARLHFNDGLLAQSYQQDYGISFEEAMDRIKDRVQELQGYLSQGKYLTLGQIGYMHRNEEGRIVFRPYTNNPFDPSAYGLRPLRCQASVHKALPEKEHDFGRWLVAVAACLLLMLLLNPVQYRLNDRNLNLQEASVISACSLYNEPAAETANAVPANAETANVAPANESTSSPAITSANAPELASANTATATNTATAANSAVSTNSAATASGPTAEILPQATPRYCIVVASFTNEADAQRWLDQKQLKKKFPQAGLASKEGRTRVYVLGFEQREAALNYLADFRASDQKYAKSWVLVN